MANTQFTYNHSPYLPALDPKVLEYCRTLPREKMEFTNIPADATIRTVISDGFTIKDGHPTFNKTYTEPVNAREFAKELIKHTYQNGYNLPDMPTE